MNSRSLRKRATRQLVARSQRFAETVVPSVTAVGTESEPVAGCPHCDPLDGTAAGESATQDPRIAVREVTVNSLLPRLLDEGRSMFAQGGPIARPEPGQRELDLHSDPCTWIREYLGLDSETTADDLEEELEEEWQTLLELVQEVDADILEQERECFELKEAYINLVEDTLLGATVSSQHDQSARSVGERAPSQSPSQGQLTPPGGSPPAGPPPPPDLGDYIGEENAAIESAWQLYEECLRKLARRRRLRERLIDDILDIQKKLGLLDKYREVCV